MPIKTLGPSRIGSPLAALLDARRTTEHYVEECDRVLLDDTVNMVRARARAPAASSGLNGVIQPSFGTLSPLNAGLAGRGRLCQQMVRVGW